MSFLTSMTKSQMFFFSDVCELFLFLNENDSAKSIMLALTLTEDLKGLSDFACRVIRFVTIRRKDFVFLTVKQRRL